jgi:cytochrome c oxidase subunit 4
MTEQTSHPATTSEATREAEHIAHVMSLGTLVAVFVALILLTALTVAATWVDLEPWNVAVALAIATLKAALVALFFMHLRYDNPFNGLVFLTALLFLAIFVGGTLTDTVQYQPDIESYRESQPQ